MMRLPAKILVLGGSLFSVATIVPGLVVQGAEAVEPSDAARHAAKEIRREVSKLPKGKAGRPLPVASHWNQGTVEGTFEPSHQIKLLQQGSHIFPWATWPSGDPEAEQFQAYWEPLIEYWRALELPISFRGTQWNAMLVKEEYRESPKPKPWAGVIMPEGKRLAKLSPFGDVEAWRDPAKAYVDTAAMRWVQKEYPDPPLVLWVSNNEPPDLRWHEVEEQSQRYLEQYGRGQSDQFKRKVVAQGWIKRYRVMFDAMRDALEDQAWRKKVRFIGYGAFGPSHWGRWSDWREYSLVTDDWVDPAWYIWDGGSPSYYTHNWNDNRDHWVFSTQVQSMNWVFMLKRAYALNPDFWFEMSTWDGNQVGHWMEGLGVNPDGPQALEKFSSRPLSYKRRAYLKANPEYVENSKTLQYMMDGQTYPPARTAGWVQFGMWLLRPRVVREFRGHTTPLKSVKAYWLKTVEAVDRVYEHPTLKRFWRFGELVSNSAGRHPYQEAIPKQYQSAERWYLLETELDPPRPWGHQTNLPVFSFALTRGVEEAKAWLLYVHSPLKDRSDVTISVLEYGEVTVDVPREGAFYHFGNRVKGVTRIGE